MIRITRNGDDSHTIHDGAGLPPCVKAVKKPIPISAWKMTEDFEVETLEGTLRGSAGDYLLEGVRGEMYPCRADIFEETYEVTSAESSRVRHSTR